MPFQPLVRDKEVLLQAVRLCNSHAFPSRIAAVAVGLLFYLANTPTAHPYLAQPVGGLISRRLPVQEERLRQWEDCGG